MFRQLYCLIRCVLLIACTVFSAYAVSEARFPVSESSLPKTPAQTWGNKTPKVEIKSGTKITTFNNDRKLGYKKIETNEGQCDSKGCKKDGNLRLPETPNFSPANDAIAISINGNITLPRPQDPTGSVYKVNGEAKLDGKTLTLTAPTTLYVGTLTIQSGGQVNPGGDPNNLVIVTTGDATIQNSEVNAHIFSSKYLKIDGGTVNGTVTTNELLLDAGGRINGVEPSPSPQPLTCTINGNNQDFVVEFDVVGSLNYQEVVFSGGNERDTLWYTQDVNAGADYVFNEQRLSLGQRYKLRIEVERGQGNSVSRAHYYWVSNGAKQWQESKDADLKNGTITGTGVGLETMNCSREDVTPPDPVLPDLCTVFPEPVQSWKSNSSLTINLPKNGQGLYPDYYITGWTDGYLTANTQNCEANSSIHNCQGGPANGVTKKLKLPFSNVTDWSNFNSCDSATCVSGNTTGVIPTPDAVNVAFNSTLNVTIDDYDFEGDCGNGSKCTAYLDPTDANHIIVEIDKDLKNLTVHEPSLKRMTVKFTPGVKVESYLVNGTSTTYLPSGRFYFNSFKLSHTGLSFTLEDDVEMVFGGNAPVMQFTNAVDITQPEVRDPLYIYAPEGRVTLNSSQTTQELRAMILADSVTLDNNNYIRGGVTTNSLTMYKATNAVIGDSDCFSPPINEVASIEIKPYNYHLTCETDPDNIVEVHSFDIDGNLVAGSQPSLVQENGSNLSITFVSEQDGIAKFRVINNSQSTVGSYDLKATLEGTSGDTDKIEYVPYKFEVDDQYQVAGQNNQVPISVKACSASNQYITVGYTGSPTATFSYQRPQSAPVDSADLVFSAALNDSNRLADLNFKESGQIRVTITDNDFVCNEQEMRCPSEGGALKGQFDVYARPWKIAICNVIETGNSSNTNPATTTGTPGFIPSATGFSATYRPIVHSDSSGGATNECNYPITGNYSLDNGPLDLTYSVIYPEASESPQLGTVSPTTVPSFNSGSTTQTIDHSWTEVGTLAIQTGATYLTMDLDSSTQNVGRFYPKYFRVVESTVWDYPAAQSFAYMNQPFDGVTFKVEALNAAENALQNYAKFDPSLTASFALYEPQASFTGRFYSPSAVRDWQLETGKSIGTMTITNSPVSTDCAARLCWSKASAADGYQDGPFNQSGATSTTISITDLGVSNIDLIDYPAASDARLLATQPVIRFGRAVVDSLGGVTGSIMNVPLRVEFWNGSAFVTNTDDSDTNLSGVNVVGDNNTIWVEPGASAADVNLAAGGGVSSGTSSSITVSQADPVRQQTQVWLDLDRAANSAPWLRYRWQDANRAEDSRGEEDPSSVVTFGIFRGNDRVIFRGESGLIGQ